MNIKKFMKAYKDYENGCPFSDPKKLHAILVRITDAAKPEHIGKHSRSESGDYYLCSCGWKSYGFDDGIVHAFSMWREHVFNCCNKAN